MLPNRFLFLVMVLRLHGFLILCVFLLLFIRDVWTVQTFSCLQTLSKVCSIWISVFRFDYKIMNVKKKREFNLRICKIV
jgi:hypothetical protein